MRLLVTGSRYLNDYNYFSKEMDKFCSSHSIPTTVIHGAARGADTLASRWVREMNSMRNHDPVITEIEEPAKWKLHGKAAGPIRNQLMLVEHKPDMVLAFPGGKGTANMIKIARWNGVPIVDLEWLGYRGY